MAIKGLLQVLHCGYFTSPPSAIHESLHFCTTSTLAFFLYGTWWWASVLARQHRMNMVLATTMRALFTGGGGGVGH